MRSVLRILAAALLAVVIAEVWACSSHGGAFPLLNAFTADPAYGVRLEPRVKTALRSHSGRVSSVQINGEGFRGPPFPAPSDGRVVPGRVLVLGDSQVFAYGLEWESGMVAQLGGMLGRPREVFAAAVPSWGPHEYVRATRQLAPEFRPQWVIFTANAANDWMETSLPNVRRTTARDGWAMRPGFEPGVRAEFPGRSYLFGRSHLVYAFRTLLGRASGKAPPPASGGTRLLTDFAQLRRRVGSFRSRISPFVAEVAQACRSLGCKVAVVALPADVQVHEGEWAKYRRTPVDLSVTEALLTDLISDAESLGLPSVNLIHALRAASPGAFLEDDFHLSPVGHRVVAGEIAALLAAQTTGETFSLRQENP